MKNSISIEINTSNHLPLITKDYVLKNNLKEFHSFENNIENYSEQIVVRNNFSTEKRNSLVEVLLDQNKGFSKNIIDNILKLRDSKTFTVTTGHQLCLFTGPMYFIYKILQTIKLSKTLKQKYPENNFIPVYWMASDDHDFEEIKFFNSYQKKFTHEISSENLCTGDIKTKNLEKVYRDLEIEFSNKKNVKQLLQVFKESYLSNKTYSSATRHLVYELFKDYDIVVLDPNEKMLKTQFKSIIIDEISNFSTYKIVSETVGKISETYQGKFKPQVNPRKVNLFYIENQKRFRIDFKNGLFKIFNKNYSKDELLKIVESNPENFSPNVLLRPLYQESILPKPVSDLGWRPHSEHVGQTGKPVSTNLYIAIGISGAIQHLAGVSSSKIKLVINTDPDAPFFKAADYGIVGDAFDVVPRLNEKLRAFKAENN